MPAATSIGAVVPAFIVSGVVLWLIGSDPVRVYGFFVAPPLAVGQRFSDTMVKATPLILVGLACTVAFKMKLWNIGAEGQFYMGAFFASLVVLVPLVPVEPGGAVITNGGHGHGRRRGLGLLPWLFEGALRGQ
jgi:ABC-type uncharacterized transport system permease subunit